ncbi:MAG: tetratricopeptide repeat protein [Victivallaceae bacterium]|nr:tetratricopeptide repeat protein [Victivallaceae bacterium]
MEKKPFSKVKVYVRNNYNKAAILAKAGQLYEAIDLLASTVSEVPEVQMVYDRLREYQVKYCKEMSPGKKALFQLLQIFTAPVAAIKSFGDPLAGMAFCEKRLVCCVDQIAILSLLAVMANKAGAPWIEVSVRQVIREFHPGNNANLKSLAIAMQNNEQAREAIGIQQEMAKNGADLAAQNEIRETMALASIKEGKYGENGGGARNVADPSKAVIQQLMEGTIHDAAQAKILIDKFTEDLKANDSVDIRRKLADAYMVTEDFDAAYEQYKLVAEKLGVTDPALDKQIEGAYISGLRKILDELRNNPTAYEAPEEQAKQVEEEIASYQLRHALKRVQVSPNDMQLQFDLAALRFDRGETEEAERLFKSVAQNLQKRRAALVYLGRCALLRNAPDEAIGLIEEAVKEMFRMDKYKREALYFLGQAFELTGKTDRAVDCYTQIKASMENYRDVGERLARLQ